MTVKQFFKGVGITLAVLFAIFLLVFLLQGGDFFLYKFFSPKYENVKREVFENTQSYVEGARQELAAYKLDYARAKTAEEKTAIKFTVVHRFSNIDENKLDPGLKDFLREMKE
jgi:hypothetical protein